MVESQKGSWGSKNPQDIKVTPPPTIKPLPVVCAWEYRKMSDGEKVEVNKCRCYSACHARSK